MIYLESISKSFLDRKLFINANISIKRGMRIGLVGPNGVGKTTFLRILLGEENFDSGNLRKEKNISIGYLPQDIVKGINRPILDELLTTFSDINKVQVELNDLIDAIKRDPDNIPLINKMGEVQNRFEILGGWTIEQKAKKILTGLGFSKDQFMNHLDTFSGGWRMRVSLAKILLKEPDIIFLDEPTNHLDLDATIWLETFLSQWNGAIVLISHDRAFLDLTVNYIFEIHLKKINVYKGNYTEYVKQKNIRIEQYKSAYKNQQKQIKATERFIEKFRYKNTKSSQVQSRIKMLKKMDKIEEPLEHNSSINLNIPQPDRSPLKIVECDNVNKGYERVRVFKNLNIVLERNQKIGLVGANGAGKSTFIKLLAGVEKPNVGNIIFGDGVNVAYYAQHQLEILKENDTVYSSMLSESDNSNERDLKTFLGSFLFSGDDIDKPIRVLSGGEKARLALAKILISPTSLLLLDEPTNHLDMESRDILETALKNYGGAIVCISHDRHFLNEVTNLTCEVVDGNLKIFQGNYDYYQWKLNESEKMTKLFDEQTKKRNPSKKTNYDKKKKVRNRLTQINKSLKNLDSKIINARAEQNKPELSDNYHALNELLEKLNDLENEYLDLLEEKETLKQINI